MKQIILLLLYLNISTCFLFETKAQDIQLSIKSEKAISKGLMDSLKIPTTFSNVDNVALKTDTIQRTLYRMGYIESNLMELQKENDSLYVADFYFGKKYSAIKIYYNKENFSKKQLQMVSSEVTETYFILPFEMIPNALFKLTAQITKSGNAFARLNLSEITKSEKDEIEASLVVNSGDKRTIDSIAIKGYEKFPRSFLKYYAGVKKGSYFNKEKLVAQNENLNSLGFTNTIKPPEVLFRKDSTIVYFYLKKQNNNAFDGILGFATNEETQKVEFNGYLNLELNNNLNYGEQLVLNYKADGQEQLNFRVKATLPYLFKSPFGLSAELKIFKRDSSFVTTEQQAKITYQINPRTNTFIGYRAYDSSNLLDILIAGSQIEDFNSKFVTAGGIFTKVQNRKLFPIKTQLFIDSGIGTRKKKNNKDDQFKIETTANNIFNLNYRNSLFVQNSTSVLFSNSYLTNELFRFGGINSIRGFNENSIDASLFSVINTEYRYLFNEGTYIHSIIDLAYFENETISLKQQLYSFGIGLGLQTKAGIFKFNVANGISKDQNFNFSNTKIHISLSSIF